MGRLMIVVWRAGAVPYIGRLAEPPGRLERIHVATRGRTLFRSLGSASGRRRSLTSSDGPGPDLISAAWRSRRVVLKESCVGQRPDLTQAACRCRRTAATAFGVVWRSGAGPYSDRLAVPVSVGRLMIVVWRSGAGPYSGRLAVPVPVGRLMIVVWRCQYGWTTSACQTVTSSITYSVGPAAADFSAKILTPCFILKK